MPPNKLPTYLPSTDFLGHIFLPFTIHSEKLKHQIWIHITYRYNYQNMDELLLLFCPIPSVGLSQRILILAAWHSLTGCGRGRSRRFPDKDVSEAGLRLRARCWLTTQQRWGLENPNHEVKLAVKKATARRKTPRGICSYDGE